MAISSNATTLTFNDATTQTTAPVNTNANVNSVTLTGGTGISISGATTTGAAAATVTNTGVTSVTAGSGISVSASTGGVTISASGGGVTSLNGQTGAITNTTFNTIGSYSGGFYNNGASYTVNAGTTVSGGSIAYSTGPGYTQFEQRSQASSFAGAGLSGTWRCMARVQGESYGGCGWTNGGGLWVRVS